MSDKVDTWPNCGAFSAYWISVRRFPEHACRFLSRYDALSSWPPVVLSLADWAFGETILRKERGTYSHDGAYKLSKSLIGETNQGSRGREWPLKALPRKEWEAVRHNGAYKLENSPMWGWSGVGRSRKHRARMACKCDPHYSRKERGVPRDIDPRGVVVISVSLPFGEYFRRPQDRSAGFYFRAMYRTSRHLQWAILEMISVTSPPRLIWVLCRRFPELVIPAGVYDADSPVGQRECLFALGTHLYPNSFNCKIFCSWMW